MRTAQIDKKNSSIEAFKGYPVLLGLVLICFVFTIYWCKIHCDFELVSAICSLSLFVIVTATCFIFGSHQKLLPLEKMDRILLSTAVASILVCAIFGIWLANTLLVKPENALSLWHGVRWVFIVLTILQFSSAGVAFYRLARKRIDSTCVISLCLLCATLAIMYETYFSSLDMHTGLVASLLWSELVLCTSFGGCAAGLPLLIKELVCKRKTDNPC